MAELNDPDRTAPRHARGPSATWPPVAVGRFEVRKRLGGGTFGEVLLAYDPHLAREVAIKIPRKVELTDADRAAFLKEARAPADIHHPNVCPVYEAGTHDGAPYIVMRYVRGGTLADALRSAGRGLAPGVAVRFAHKIALGLAAAHARGVVHRDLKPANVLCDDASGELLIADFGLARVLDRSAASTAGVKGTPLYMPPEQWSSAHWGPVGVHSDIYALGVILFELLTGDPPFVGGPMEVMFAHCQTAPPRPSAVRPGLPPALDAICLKALAKRGADRFRSAQEFAHALVAHLSSPSFEMASPPAVPAPKPPPLPPPSAGPADTGGPGDTAADREVVRCPGCRAQLRVRAGRTKPVTCPRCDLVFGVGEARAEAQVAEPPEPARRSPRRDRSGRRRARAIDEPHTADRAAWAPVARGLTASVAGLFSAVACAVACLVLVVRESLTGTEAGQAAGFAFAVSYLLVGFGRWGVARGPNRPAGRRAGVSAAAALTAALCFVVLAWAAGEGQFATGKRLSDSALVLLWAVIAGASLLPALSELALLSCLCALGRAVPGFPDSLARFVRVLVWVLLASALALALSGLAAAQYFMREKPATLGVAVLASMGLTLFLAPIALVSVPWLYVAAARAVGRYARGEG